MRIAPRIGSRLCVFGLALAACSGSDKPAAPEAPPTAFVFPPDTPPPAEKGRALLARAAAFVPADASLVLVFRSWRDTVDSLALKGLFDHPVGRTLLEAWRVGGITVTDLPGLRSLGMEVDSSLVFAILPDGTLDLVVASETPAKLLGLFELLPRQKTGPAVKVQGRESHSYIVDDTRFTAVLHDRHFQVLITPAGAAQDAIDSVVQGAFDSAPLWLKRAEALPSPVASTIVLWTPGDPPNPTPDPAAPLNPSLMTIMAEFGSNYRAGETLQALSFPNGSMRLDETSLVVDGAAAAAKARTGISPDSLLRILPAGAAYASAALFSKADAAVAAKLLGRLPPDDGSALARLREVIDGVVADLSPNMFGGDAKPDQRRAVVTAIWPAAALGPVSETGNAAPGSGPAADVGGDVLIGLETGHLVDSDTVLRKLLEAVAHVFSIVTPDISKTTVAGAPAWKLALGRPLLCAAREPLVLCSLGEAPLKAALQLSAAGLPPADPASTVLSLTALDLPAVAGRLGGMLNAVGAGSSAEIVSLLAEDIGTITFSERLTDSTAAIVVKLGDRGHPILPSLVPRVVQKVGPLLHGLE